MQIIQAIKERHSVRHYLDKPIEENLILELQNEINECNSESGLNIQLVINEPEAFNGNNLSYGWITGVKNYVALVGSKSKNLEELVGYYGERIAIKAQMLGLNTCWVALTYKKNKAKVIVNENEKLVCVLALGYGKTQGVQHKSKPLNKLSNLSNNSPEWFKNGVELVSLAPTAVNQQKFYFEQVGNQVLAKPGIGFHVKTDLGIAKYHFEIGAGINNFTWK